MWFVPLAAVHSTVTSSFVVASVKMYETIAMATSLRATGLGDE